MTRCPTEICAAGQSPPHSVKSILAALPCGTLTPSLSAGVPEAVLDALPFYFLLVDAEHTILFANEAVREALGVGATDIVGSYCPRVVHGLDHPFPGCPLEEAAGRDVTVEREFHDASTDRWVSSAIYPTSLRTPAGLRVYAHIVRDIDDRRRAEGELAAYQERLRSMALELCAAEERERRRIASDLHDQIGQKLALSMMEISSLEAHAASPAVAKSLAQVRSHIAAALSDAKTLMFDLSPPVLHQFGLGSAIEWLLEQVAARTGLKCELEQRGGSVRLGDDQTIFLFRATQELVTNVHKHAHAERVDVRLTCADGFVEVVVEDDGVGLPPSHRTRASRRLPQGFGLFSIEERLTHLRGEMHVEPGRERGTRITLKLPESDDEERGGR